MDHRLLDRRRLLQWGGYSWATLLAGGSGKLLAQQAVDSRLKGELVHLSPPLGAALEAIAARILPTTDTPGAREAGAIWFIDAALGGQFAGDLPMVESGIAQLNEAAGGRFADLPDHAQDSLLAEWEDTPLFGLVHFLTLAGCFTMSSYGGNQNETGWDLIGFERAHHWQPPFGHYDRIAMAEGDDT